MKNKFFLFLVPLPPAILKMQPGLLKIESVAIRVLNEEEDLIEWAINIQSSLIEEGLWDIVDGTEKKPLLSKGANYSSRQCWTERNERACTLLLSGLGDFMSTRTTKDFWDDVIFSEDLEEVMPTANYLWLQIWESVEELEWHEHLEQNAVAFLRIFEAEQETRCSDETFLKALGAWIHYIHVLKLLETGLKSSTRSSLNWMATTTVWEHFCERFPQYKFQDNHTGTDSISVQDTKIAEELLVLLDENWQAECNERGITSLKDIETNIVETEAQSACLEQYSVQPETNGMIKLLDSSVSFVNWYRQMQIFLFQNGLSSITNGWETRPSDQSSKLSDQVHWDLRNQKAKGFLLSAVGPHATLRLLAPLRDRKDMSALDLLLKIAGIDGHIRQEKLDDQLKKFLLLDRAVDNMDDTVEDRRESHRLYILSYSQVYWTKWALAAHCGLPSTSSIVVDKFVGPARDMIRDRKIDKYNEYFKRVAAYEDDDEETIPEAENVVDREVSEEDRKSAGISKEFNEEEDREMMDGASKESPEK